MEFDYYSPSETFVVLTADQFVGRDDGLLEQQKTLNYFKMIPILVESFRNLH